MGRPKTHSDDLCLKSFLLAVWHNPWAASDWLQTYSGLSRNLLQRVAQPLALSRGLVERGDLHSTAHAARRFGLTPAGAALLGQRHSLGALRDAYLRARTLDDARCLLTDWMRWPGLKWALSPFTLPATALRPPAPRPMGRRRSPPPGGWGEGAYHSLRLDALACLRCQSGSYLNLAIWVDPGDLSLDWFHHQFRSAYVWYRRPEFYGQACVYPDFVVLAASDTRLQQIAAVCWNARPYGCGHPLVLRMTTRAALTTAAPQRPWWNERGEPIGLGWNPRGCSELPSLPPEEAESAWWGQMARRAGPVIHLCPPLALKRKPAGLLQWAAKSPLPAARLVRDHRAVSVRAIGLLNRVGQYPLTTTGELAHILGQTHKNIAVSLTELLARRLITHPNADEDGYMLTPAGLALLAAQAGFAPHEYARLRRWPVWRDGRQVHYAVDALLACRAHTRFVLDFLIGLRRYGPRARLKLQAWDHMQCIHEFPNETEPRTSRSGPQRAQSDSARVIPDANGIVRAFGETAAQYVDTPFWLEVDRHTEKGRALIDKLMRFYRYSSSLPWYSRRVGMSRLLILVERDDEARLQALRRRLLALNQRWQMELDVRLTRADLLDNSRGRLDPTQCVWRTPASSQFVSAFDLPGR